MDYLRIPGRQESASGMIEGGGGETIVLFAICDFKRGDLDLTLPVGEGTNPDLFILPTTTCAVQLRLTDVFLSMLNIDASTTVDNSMRILRLLLNLTLNNTQIKM